MEILLLILGVLMMLLALWCCMRPHIPSVIPAYAGIWLLQWSRYLEFPSVMLAYWGVMVAIVVVVSSMLSPVLLKTTQGMLHITLSSLAGMLLGLSFGYAPMVVGAFVGAAAGTLFFSRTPKGAGLRGSTYRVVQYFCAKGLPAVITVSLAGIAIEVAIVQLV